MSVHLESAARAFEAVLRELRPEHHWIAEVRPRELDERAGGPAATVRGDDAGAAHDDAAALLDRSLPAAAGGAHDHDLEQAA